MLLRRITHHVKTQNWFAIFIDFFIVVVGVFIGIQVANWNEERANRQRETQILENIAGELQADIDGYDLSLDSGLNRIAAIKYILGNVEVTSSRNLTHGTELSGLRYNDYIEQLFESGTKSFSERSKLINDELWSWSVLVSNAMPSSTTFDSLVSTGELGIVKNDLIVRKLQEYRYLTTALLKAQEVTFRPRRDNAIDIGLGFGLSPFMGVEKKHFLTLVSNQPTLMAVIQTQLGWAKGHFTMIGASSRSAKLLLIEIEKELKVKN